MEELWRDIPGYEDYFEIDRAGRVRSKPRYVNSPICGGRRLIGGKLRTLSIVKGYPALQAKIEDKQVTIYIHRVLAQLFLPNPDSKPEVNHIDGNTRNFCLSNLEWCTHKENMQHAYRTGLAKPVRNGAGAQCHAAKLTNEAVLDIKRRLARGERQRDIAAVHGVSQTNISSIRTGKTWGSTSDH